MILVSPLFKKKVRIEVVITHGLKELKPTVYNINENYPTLAVTHFQLVVGLPTK
jgi:hypothetical protein